MNVNTKSKRCFIVSPHDPFAVLGQGDIAWTTLDGTHAVKMDDTMCIENYPADMVTYWDDIQDIAPYLAHDSMEMA